MKVKFNQLLKSLSHILAPLMLALAIVTVNSTCWCFTFQPEVPKELERFVK